MQTASHLSPEAEAADKQLVGQKESWGQLQSLKRAPSETSGMKDAPGNLPSTPHSAKHLDGCIFRKVGICLASVGLVRNIARDLGKVQNLTAEACDEWCACVQTVQGI